MDAKTLTRKGIELKKAGDKAGATQLLTQAIEADSQLEVAWLWLASCLSVAAEQRYCIEQALAINPDSQAAQAALVKFSHVLAACPAVLGEEKIEAPFEIAPAAPAVLTRPIMQPVPATAVTPTQPLRQPKAKRSIWPIVSIVSIIGILLVSVSVGAYILAPATVASIVPIIATPTPTCEVGLPVFVATLEPLAREWDDANAVANSTPRASLALQISNLQSVRRRVQDITTPLCGAGMKDHLVNAMDATIEGYIAFLGQKSDTEVQRHFTTASTEMDAYKSFVEKILLTRSSS